MTDSKKDEAQLVGAKEKRKIAQEALGKKGANTIQSRRAGEKPTSPALVIGLLYFMSVVLAWFLTRGPWKNGAGFKTGHDGIDQLFLSARGPAFFGDADLDMIGFALVRGIFIFCAAGLLPGLAWLWVRLLDRASTNPYRAVWGVAIGAPLVWFLFLEGLYPLLAEVYSIIFG